MSTRSLGPHGSVSYAASRSAILDRGSLFTAQVCWPVKTVHAANAAIALMRAEAPALGADHNMSAFRVIVNKKTEKAYDDDGEARGGQVRRSSRPLPRIPPHVPT
jgi:putative IMPACT (imprinted ancient) family translation regulator